MTVFSFNPALGSARRWRPLEQVERTISAAEFALLVVVGFGSAVVSAFGIRGLEIPGHNILRVVVPMALGLALVPRRGSASIMGLGAGAGGAVLWLEGVRGMGAGATTSLALTGFFLDLALIGARSGRSVYWRLALAGLASNMLAFAAKLVEKLSAAEPLDRHPLWEWLPRALASYPVCGLLAGLIGAAACFRFTVGPRSAQAPKDTA
jgi:hypothetical protein